MFQRLGHLGQKCWVGSLDILTRDYFRGKINSHPVLETAKSRGVNLEKQLIITVTSHRELLGEELRNLDTHEVFAWTFEHDHKEWQRLSKLCSLENRENVAENLQKEKKIETSVYSFSFYWTGLSNMTDSNPPEPRPRKSQTYSIRCSSWLLMPLAAGGPPPMHTSSHTRKPSSCNPPACKDVNIRNLCLLCESALKLLFVFFSRPCNVPTVKPVTWTSTCNTYTKGTLRRALPVFYNLRQTVSLTCADT